MVKNVVLNDADYSCSLSIEFTSGAMVLPCGKGDATSADFAT